MGFRPQADSTYGCDLPLPRRIWWPWDDPVDTVGFERRISVSKHEEGVLFVAASGTYQVWWDGRGLSTPPAHAPSWRIVHRLPVTLEPGEHVLRIEADPGPHGQPFLLAWLDWCDRAEPRAPGVHGTETAAAGLWRRIGTDGEWWMIANPRAGWAEEVGRAAQSSNGQPGWRPAWAFDGVWAEPWGMPCDVPDDFCRLTDGRQVMTREAVLHVAQVHQGLTSGGTSAKILPDGAMALRPAFPYPPAPFPIPDVRKQDLAYRSREAHSHILNHRLELFEARAPHVVFDLGEETFGRLRLRLRSGGPAIIAVTTGESLPEVHKHLGRVTDVFELRDDESFATGPTGFRYVKVMGLSAGGPGSDAGDATAILEPIEVQHIRYPVEPVGSFSCSDPVLNGIWQLSARTVHLCMQNEIWDGIKRDQLPWMGDLYTEALAVYHAFGDTRPARWSLGVLGELGPVPDRALTAQRYPGLQSMWKRPNTDINGIPSYTLRWVVGLADYLRYSGDRSLIVDLADELTATLEHVRSWVGEDGWWRHRDGWDYVDWAPLSQSERGVFGHLLACQVMGLGAELLEAIGRQGAACRETGRRMADTARREIWRDGRGDLGASHHVPAMLIRSGILRQDEAAAVFQQFLASDPPYRMTYWHRYADLEAAAITGQIAWGLDYIRRHWGPALKIGVTSLWEAFDPAWIGDDPHAVAMVAAEYARYGGYETSLCHGWSAGPAVWLHRAVLGVSPTATGFTTLRFAPALGSLSWAEGTIPSPHGPIRVRLDGSSRGGQATVLVPEDIKVERADNPRARWEVDVRPVHAGSARPDGHS